MEHFHSFATVTRWFSVGCLIAACSCGSSSGSGGTGNGGGGMSTTGGASGAGGAMGISGAAAMGGAIAAGAGGAGGAACLPNAAPPATTGVCSGMGTRVLTLADQKIEDFEADTISPGWSSFDQPDDGGAHDVFKMTLVTTDGAATTKQSGEYKGTGILTVKEGGFGAGSVYNVAIDNNLKVFCIDVSAFDGVAFWAKAGVTGKKVSVSFVVPETNPQGAPGGDCLTNCYQHPSKTITLTDQWAQYTVKFSEAAGGTAKVNGRIQELLWTTPDKDFDFHLDEIAFYKCTPPSGPVGP